MDDPQPQSVPISILNNQKVPGRDRDIPRNNLGQSGHHNSHCVLRAYFMPNALFTQAYERGTIVILLHR